MLIPRSSTISKRPCNLFFYIIFSVWFCDDQIAIASKSPDFEKDIVPILYHHCSACHTEKQVKQKGKLRLDTAEGNLSFNVIVPGKPDDNELMTPVSLPRRRGDAAAEKGVQPLVDGERSMYWQWIADGTKMNSCARFDHRGSSMSVVDMLQ